MDLRSLRSFLALHRLGTIAAAADEVHLSPAAVSMQLKVLEQRLDMDLFMRTKRSIRLTPAGFRLVPLAEKMLALYDEMTKLDASAVQGKLALGVWAVHDVFPDVIHRLKLENTRMDIRIVTGVSSVLMAQVHSGLLDAAIITRPPNQLVDNLLVTRDLFAEPMALVMPKRMKYQGLAEILQSAPYIAMCRTSWLGRQIGGFLSKHDIHVRSTMEFDTVDAIVSVVSHGLGVSILPVSRNAAFPRDPTLRIVPLPGLDRVVSLVERKAHPNAHLTGRLINAFEAARAEEAADADAAERTRQLA